jgi:hypothetical protein
MLSVLIYRFPGISLLRRAFPQYLFMEWFHRMSIFVILSSSTILRSEMLQVNVALPPTVKYNAWNLYCLRGSAFGAALRWFCGLWTGPGTDGAKRGMS